MVINHFPELILRFVEFFEIDRCMYQKQVKHKNPKILEEKKNMYRRLQINEKKKKEREPISTTNH